MTNQTKVLDHLIIFEKEMNELLENLDALVDFCKKNHIEIAGMEEYKKRIKSFIRQEKEKSYNQGVKDGIKKTEEISRSTAE